MELFLAISQGTGLAVATGLRPFLPPLLAGALARADLGLDFEGTDFAFLESIVFLAAILALTGLAYALPRFGIGRLALALGVVAVVIGALLFGGSLADEGYSGAAGVAAGAVCALLAYLAATTFLRRAAGRLEARGGEGSVAYLTAFTDVAALALAGLAVLAPPVSFLALGFCAWVLAERRRRESSKYEGLRVLR